MSVIYYVSSNPEYYGSDCTEEEAYEAALKIVEKAASEYPEVEFRIGDSRDDWETEQDAELFSSVRQTINDKWSDWIV